MSNTNRLESIRKEDRAFIEDVKNADRNAGYILLGLIIGKQLTDDNGKPVSDPV